MRTKTSKRAAGVILAIVMVSLLAPRARALPPDPDNAALLYYQGFLSLAELDDEARALIGDVAKGQVAPDDKVRQYIQQCQGGIGFAEAAAEVPACDWGFRFSEGFNALMPQLAQARSLAFVLVAEARVRAADGDSRGALERCLMTETLARHVGDDTLIFYLVSLAVRELGYKCMADVVGQACDDPTLLRWLRDELAKSPGPEVSALRPLKIEMEIATDLMRMDRVKELVETLTGSLEEGKMEEITAQANETILAQARRRYSERARAALKTLSTPMPYEQAHAQLKQLEDGADMDDPAASLANAFAPGMSGVLSSATRTAAHAHAIRAGIEVYLRRAESGTLPAALPAALPKDPFSGEDFEYERQDGGFVLRCRAKDLNRDTVHEYAFAVK